MISKPRSLRVPRNPIGVLILLSAFAVAAGCSTANTPGGGGDVVINHVNASGNSVPGWVAPTGGSHANSATMNYIANGGTSSCTECHGSDLAGGISGVSCFANTAGCHHGPIPNWITAAVHGATAKKAPGSSGFAACQICHGRDFSGGGAKVSCYTCHGVSAPHAPKPWRASAGATFSHTNTDPANAPICAKCHFQGSPNNPANHPATPAPAGTAPGCFNSTLCHGAAGAPHPVGSTWVATSPAAQPHGNSAKATPGATAGFSYCQDCHGTGTNFSGGSSGVSCYPCHVPTANSPHASQWRTGDTYVHTSTAEGNAPVCAFCHLDGTNSPIAPPSPSAPAGTAPGCFNSTLCHGSGVVGHPVPFNSSAHYGVSSSTFSSSCSVCHDVSGTSTKSGPVCQTCHIAGSPLTAINCVSCHANPPSGAASSYPNVAGAHAAHIALNGAGTPIACDTCHNGLGTGTLNHYNRANARPGEDALRVSPGDVAFVATYNAKTGASSFDNSAALNCSNVSCHGGQNSPNWQTGTIDVPNACLSCHALGTAQYNSFNSGRHSLHIGEFGLSDSTCKLCHNTTTLAASHFTALGTTTMEGPASATIGGPGTGITAGNYVAATKSCSPTCHGTETW